MLEPIFGFKINKCIKCGFDKHVECAEYCQNCGFSLRNFCTNSNCDITNSANIDSSSLPLDAKYCPYSKTKTTFSEYL